MSDWKDFKMGFRHPFGVHAKELPQDILSRKKGEVERNGWTLWSFRAKNFEIWHEELEAANPPSVFVFCLGNGGDPGGEKRECTELRYVNESSWKDIPKAIKVPHPFNSEQEAGAFVVERVEYPIRSFSPPAVEWFSFGKREWQDGIKGAWGMQPYPTRGEYLIRPGKTYRMHKEIHAILKLKYPYLAYVRI